MPSRSDITAASPTARSRLGGRYASCWLSPEHLQLRVHLFSGWRIIAAITRLPTGRVIPIRHGVTVRVHALSAKGLVYAHVGWMLEGELGNRSRFAPDTIADRDLMAIGRLSAPLVAVSLFVPACVGGLVTGTWSGALAGFFWAGIIREGFLHHVTWSVNSVCHVVGRRPFACRDRATNFWPLAILSMGESWHNSHHADPTLARHGTLPRQIDPAARLIWLL